jgi:hypothetical protein
MFYTMKMPFEVVGVSTIHFGTITAVAVLAMGFGRADRTFAMRSA